MPGTLLFYDTPAGQGVFYEHDGLGGLLCLRRTAVGVPVGSRSLRGILMVLTPAFCSTMVPEEGNATQSIYTQARLLRLVTITVGSQTPTPAGL
jgi:hypothetical protein